MLEVEWQSSESEEWLHIFGSVTSILFYTTLSEYDKVRYTRSVPHIAVLIIPAVEPCGGISRVIRVCYKHAVVLTDLDNLIHDQDRRIPPKNPKGTPSCNPPC